jgi:hypothetical protein
MGNGVRTEAETARATWRELPLFFSAERRGDGNGAPQIWARMKDGGKKLTMLVGRDERQGLTD